MSKRATKVLTDIESQDLWMIVGPEKGRLLADQVRKKKARRIMEVGTYVGYSAILMADNAGDDAEIVSIEVDLGNAGVARENIKKAGYQNNIEVLVGAAKEVIPTLKGNFDFMFIDAIKEDYLDYLKLAEDKLEKGAVVVADNVKMFKQSMLDYLDYVRESEKYKSIYIEVGQDALEVSVKK
ncbi:MAG: class I SAM-dependent methyltransferase [Candidatus Woesebacteria bacterium]|jgi:predicted O-methyltransferase YrrM